jgi:polysaccharide export outer membrane protein
MSRSRRFGLTGPIFLLSFVVVFVFQAIALEYLIGPDDVLRVSFWQAPDLDTVSRVRQDGRISLPVVGEVQAVGLTLSQLEERIVEQISIYNKEISQARVEVVEYNSQRIFITGEVYRPGKYTFEFIPNLWEVIREAGGPRERAMLSEVTIIRADQKAGEKITVNLSQALESGDLSTLPMLKPGDTVIVPGLPAESTGTTMDMLGRSVIFIYGQIARPGVYPIDENSTLLQAIAQAGGPAEGADLKNVRVIIRQGRRSAVTKVDIEKHTRLGVPSDFALHPGDTVVVPKRSGLWRGVWSGMTQIVTVTSGLFGIIYVIDWLSN